MHFFICDAPARSFLIHGKSHTGYHSCTKCLLDGEYYERRVIFLYTNSNWHTDNSFALKLDDHHTGVSILESLGIGMVNKDQISGISAKLLEYKKYITHEFSRKPRPLEELDRWKATEYRQFLLCTGPVILKQFLPSERYKHFTTLSTAIRIFVWIIRNYINLVSSY